MDEGDAMTSGPRARCPVDQTQAGGDEAPEIALEVVGTVGDVVQPLTLAIQEAPDRGVGGERLEELDGAHESDANALIAKGFQRGARSAREHLERRGALRDGVDGDRDVIEGPFGEGSRASRRAGRGRGIHRPMLHWASDSDKESLDGNE
jgi:hypothetical protein